MKTITEKRTNRLLKYLRYRFWYRTGLYISSHQRQQVEVPFLPPAYFATRARQTLDGKWAVGKKIAVKYASASRDVMKKKKKGDGDGQGEDTEGVALRDLPQSAKSAQIRAIEAKLSAMSRTEEKDFNVNPEIKKYQSMKKERMKPYDRNNKRR